MYRYIECNNSETAEHFRKFRHLDEIKNHVNNLNNDNWHQDVLNSSLDEDYFGSEFNTSNIPDVHVYRIKDITDAINTSIILDHTQKEEYHNLLSDKASEFNADVDFMEICRDVGECDIY